MRKQMFVFLRFFNVVLYVGAFAGSAMLNGQTWERDTINFERISQRAEELASSPFSKESYMVLPDWARKLTYDQLRDIRFRPESAIWLREGLPYRMMMFHPGFLFLETVKVFEFTSSHYQQIRFSGDFFSYGALLKVPQDVPSDLGFAGFRLHCPLNSQEYYDELVSFLGGSYFRALGKKQHYGISARGIAVDTGVEGATEEFPSFREFWVQKPEKNDKHVQLYALMDGESLTGVYHFKFVPGEDTVVEVKARLFFRKSVKRLGIAPMSSMFWFGENSMRKFDDFRPEVHDSDGLLIKMSSEETVWRPLMNDTGRLEFSFFRMNTFQGFGLMQRDRSFASYEDPEAVYHLRPSLWVEPVSGFENGELMLMEIPTKDEFSDNVVALWQPLTIPAVGKPYNFSYRQYWTLTREMSDSAKVVGMRTGLHSFYKERRIVAVDFKGDALAKLADVGDWVCEVEARAVKADKQVFAKDVFLSHFPDGRVRMNFQLTVKEDQKLSEQGAVELRAFIRNKDKRLTETWVYRINL